MIKLKASLLCRNRYRANAKAITDRDRVESEVQDSQLFNFDKLRKNEENKQQRDEATIKVESLLSKLLETNKTIIFLNQKINAYNIAYKTIQDYLNNEALKKQQNEIEQS